MLAFSSAWFLVCLFFLSKSESVSFNGQQSLNQFRMSHEDKSLGLHLQRLKKKVMRKKNRTDENVTAKLSRRSVYEAPCKYSSFMIHDL